MAEVTGMIARMDGGYEPPILVEPPGGPVPEWQPNDDIEQDNGEEPPVE